ncbi:MAG TPA: glycosyl hydrolase [Candidatus Baltobacteraceae bacterium]|nr:glycosyl hydrolase [Candidatus Baltobacteraceae bacterium]
MPRQRYLVVGSLLSCLFGALVLSSCGPRIPIAASIAPAESKRQVSPQATPTPLQLPIMDDDNTGPSGLFLGAVCLTHGPLRCGNFAKVLRHHIALGTEFASWNSDLVKFMKQQGMNSWPAQKITPEITWMPIGVTYDAINSGQYDAYITAQAQELKKFRSSVFLRPFHEFNGYWYPWGLPNQGGNSDTDKAFIAAWQRMVNIFRQQGASNVKFVWCFSSSALHAIQNEPWDDPAQAYPGDDYVDWISFDGYNRGTLANPKQWVTFDSLISQAYQLSISISNAKPISISEIASNEYGDGGAMKSAWILQMLTELTGADNPYPHIRLVSWYEADSVYQYDTESSDLAYTAFAMNIRGKFPSGLLKVRSNGSALARVTAP